jgi:hypothetical protein
MITSLKEMNLSSPHWSNPLKKLSPHLSIFPTLTNQMNHQTIDTEIQTDQMK